MLQSNAKGWAGMVHTNSSVKPPTIPYYPKAARGPIKQAKASTAVSSTAHLTYGMSALCRESPCCI